VEFLREHRLIPVDRFGDLLTVCMPAIVPADVLGMLAALKNLHVQPLVGTVETNNRWFEEHLPRDIAPALPHDPDEWSEIFDEGDAAVLMELGDEDEDVDGMNLGPPVTEIEDNPFETES